MSQETYNLLSVIAQFGSVLVAIAVGIVVWLYTEETKKLREAAVQQVALARNQLLLSVKPYVFTTIVNFARGGGINTVVASPADAYRCHVWNPTDRPAHNVNVLVRDRGRGFFWTAEGADALICMDPLMPGKDLTARGGTMDVGLAGVRTEYGPDVEPHLHRLADLTEDYSAVFFRDSDGRLYAAVRIVHLAGGGPPFPQEQNKIWDQNAT